jgi:hypothetical protein
MCGIGLIVGLAIDLGGCASAGVCAGWRPIFPSRDDKLTDRTARDILGHDEYGLALGCPGFTPKRQESRTRG